MDGTWESYHDCQMTLSKQKSNKAERALIGSTWDSCWHIKVATSPLACHKCTDTGEGILITDARLPVPLLPLKWTRDNEESRVLQEGHTLLWDVWRSIVDQQGLCLAHTWSWTQNTQPAYMNRDRLCTAVQVAPQAMQWAGAEWVRGIMFSVAINQSHWCWPWASPTWPVSF